MLEQYLGETSPFATAFACTSQAQLRQRPTTDLWDALEEESGQPVRDVMDTWIFQGGVPLVTFTNGELVQQPFVYGKSGGESAIGSTWLVPVLTRSLNSAERSRHLLADAAISVIDPLPVVVNAGGSGVFRSRYGQAELRHCSSAWANSTSSSARHSSRTTGRCCSAKADPLEGFLRHCARTRRPGRADAVAHGRQCRGLRQARPRPRAEGEPPRTGARSLRAPASLDSAGTPFPVRASSLPRCAPP